MIEDSIEINYDYLNSDYSLFELINRTSCPVCSAKLYWSIVLTYDSESFRDEILLNSSGCGKSFVVLSDLENNLLIPKEL